MQRDTKRSPDQLSLYSTLSFDWVSPIMDLGYKRPLQESDIFTLPDRDKCLGISERLKRNFDELKPSLFNALKREWFWLTVQAGLWKILNDASQFTGPIFMSLILKGLTDFSVAHLSCFAFCMYAFQIIGAVGEAQYFQSAMRVGMQLRSALMGLIFQKSLRLSMDSRTHGVSSGKITNMVSSDTESLQGFCEVMHVLWSAPVRILTSMVLLYYLLGISALFGASVLVGMIPVQNKLVKQMTARVKKAQLFTDERLKVVSETFEGIQLVKCYSWEEAFRKKLSALREKELKELFKYSLIRAFNSFLILAIPVLVAVFSFSAYTLLPWNPPLTAVQAFTALSLFQVLRFPLMQLPSVINSLGACKVSIDRISNFLTLPELLPGEVSASPADSSINIKEGIFKWPKSDFSLKIPNLEISKGDLVIVVGHTAGGKSSLLQALLGNVPLVSAKNCVTINPKNHSIAYCAQNAWIFSASVRENISFGSLLVDESKYNSALRAVEFAEDLDRMPDRDFTEIGERGVNLSGGQKQRLSLARALNAGSETTVLLDDPLSALDAAVASKVYMQAIVGALGGSTRVLVTNRLEAVIPSVKTVNPKFVIVSNGVVSPAQSFDELMKNNTTFAALVNKVSSCPSESQDEVKKIEDAEKFLDPKKITNVKQIIVKEDRKTGAVSQSTVSVYISALGKFPLIVLFCGLSETARVLASIWLSDWSGTFSYLSIYVLISLAQLVFSLASQILTATCGNAAAGQLHYRMFDRLIIAPMNFFHSTPLGRILNRFSKDVGDLDKNLAAMFGMSLNVTFSLISTLLLLAGTAYLTVLAMVPLMIAFFYLQGYYRATSREIKRMDSISRSPIYAHFSQIQEGMDTVLAFNKGDFVKMQNANFIDNHIRFNLMQMSCNRWLGIRLEFYGGAIVLATALFIVSARTSLPVGIAGLALSTALQVTGGLGGIVRVGAMLENSLNSVERVHEYASIESENVMGNSVVPPSGWPKNGSFSYKNVIAAYRNAKPVLNNISFCISGGQKVGVIGRTGAGKTSLILTLFRILEIESGTITIDGIDIAKLPLKELRKTLGIIPQDPIVFEGTVRDNIDPFNIFSDEEITNALAAAHLTNLPLDHCIVQGGKNLSSGQRQQVCLARVLLRRPKILVLDEATSSLDAVTDNLVVETIRDEFKHSTVITIAHRLHTIVDSDLLIALDSGEIGEIGSPAELIHKPDGIFASLVKETGSSTSKYLRDRI